MVTDATVHEALVPVADRLLEAATQDVAELLPALLARADLLAAEPAQKLTDRGRRERSDLAETSPASETG